MTAHDPLCREDARLTMGDQTLCDCDLIARVRADERERLADAMHGLWTDGEGWVMLRDVWATITRLGGESDG